MNLLPAGLNAMSSRTKVLLGVLVALIAAFFLLRNSDTPGPAAASVAPATAPSVTAPPAFSRTDPTAGAPPLPTAPRAGGRRQGDSIQDFRPTLKLPEGTDVSRVDPELHLDMLAKMRNIAQEGGRRSLFEFGAVAAPVIPKVAPIKPAAIPVGPVPPPPPPAPVTPPKPVIPPIPLKFYGYINGRGAIAPGAPKRAFFLDGDDIVVAGENDLIRNRFRVIRIDLNSALVEDTSTKSQQTLMLVEEVPG